MIIFLKFSGTFIKISNNNNNNNMVMGFSRMRQYSTPNRNEIVIPVPEIIEPSDGDKMKWGAPTWYMLHTIAEKVDTDKFYQIRVDLLQIISMIISNLPCPTCSTHGIEYLKKVDFYTIQSKENLKRMLFDFHNSVNARKHFAKFTYEELNTKYSNAITSNIMQTFFYYFTKKSNNIRLITDDIHRNRVSVTITEFFNSNRILFSP